MLDPLNPRPPAFLNPRDPVADLPTVPMTIQQLAQTTSASGRRGITNTVEVLDFTETFRDTFLDGLQPHDIQAAPALMRRGIKAYRDADEIPAELADLDEEEFDVVSGRVLDLFGPVMDGISTKIGSAFAGRASA